MTASFIKLNRLTFFLALLGMAIAAYVTQSFLRQTPIICINTGCELVRNSPLSYPFGLPVPAFGFIGYTLLALLSFLRTSLKTAPLTWAMLAISFGGVLFVTWFTFTEIFIIHALCTWCALSALNMFVVFLLILKSKLIESNVLNPK